MENGPTLFIPGPVEVEASVLAAQEHRMENHRGKAFKEVLACLHGNLQGIFQTKQRVFLLSSSGTGANEAALANIIGPDDRVLCVSNGEFGQRLCEQSKLYSQNVEVLDFGWGAGAHADKVAERIDSFKPDIVTVVQNDTSTGVQNPVKEISFAAKAAGALVVVDSVSSLGGADLRFDEWGIGACASAAQKCIGGTPGLSFLAVSDEAWEKIAARKSIPTFYFNLPRYERFWTTVAETPFTPAISPAFALDVALQELHAEGLESSFARHAKAADSVRKVVAELGYELFAEEGYRSNTLTAFWAEGAQAKKQALLQAGFEIGAGFKDYKDKLLRIGHMGRFDELRLQELLEALGKIS
ncbi:alanine--glyoxylate aminotransferase family protein [Candidatus Micrarchaeota archaeon]|nr:alanine--glyoxylate aminotransferase family protein [Candidatus Micrarchaeota archaeon]